MGLIPTSLTVSACSDGACPYPVVEAGGQMAVGGRLTVPILPPLVSLPVSGAKVRVEVSWEGGQYELEAVTSGDGSYSLVVPAPTQPGQVAVRASFPGTDVLAASSASATAYVLSQAQFYQYVAELKALELARDAAIVALAALAGVALGAVLSR